MAYMLFLFFSGVNFDLNAKMAVHLKLRFRRLHWTAKKKKRQKPHQEHHRQETRNNCFRLNFVFCVTKRTAISTFSLLQSLGTDADVHVELKPAININGYSSSSSNWKNDI